MATKAVLPKLRLLGLLLCLLISRFAAAARQEQEHSLIRTEVVGDDSSQASTKRLNTYYFDAFKPIVELSSRVSARPERTGLTVKLSKESVSSFMSVVTPRPSGMVHSVSNTWQALQNLATMFGKVKAINEQTPGAPRLFPKAAVAVSAASDNSPAKFGVASMLQVAEATKQRNLWAEVTPSSVLLLPHAQSTGAVADVLDVTWDDKAGVVTLELDLVHNPHTLSEFSAHDKQTMDVTEAHYHFATAPGVSVDAPTLLRSLESSAFNVEGLHLFVKGKDIQYGPCWDATLVADTSQAPIGSTVTVSATITGQNVDCLCGGAQNLCTDLCPNFSAEFLCCTDDPYCCQDPLVNYCFDESKTNSSVTPGARHSTGHGRWRGGARQFDSQPVVLSVAGNAVLTYPTRSATPGKAGVRQALTGGNNILLTTDAQNVATALLQVTGPGPIVVYVVDISVSVPYTPTAFAINALESCDPSGGSSPVAKLVLSPTKAYRHCHDSITLYAAAVDDNKNPVVNATVAFAVFGDCEPVTQQASAVTDANGVAFIRLVSDKPGAVSVVAATTNSTGAVLLSEPAHVFFFNERRHADEREREYFREEEHHGHERYSDADKYAQLAQQRAKQLVKQTA